MNCIEFWAWFGSGVVLVPLLAWLKSFPKVGEFIDKNAWIVAPMLAALLPQIAQFFTEYCAVIDPKLWAVIMAGLTYLVSQVLYWTNKKLGISTKLGLSK